VAGAARGVILRADQTIPRARSSTSTPEAPARTRRVASQSAPSGVACRLGSPARGRTTKARRHLGRRAARHVAHDQRSAFWRAR